MTSGTTSSTIDFAESPSLQLRVLGLGLFQDGDVGVGVFPEGEPTQRLPIHARLTVLPELARAGLHR